MRKYLILGFSLVGLIYCFSIAMGVDLFLCDSVGCSIYKDYEFLGLSFYVWGVVGFGLLLLMLLFDRWFEYYFGVHFYKYFILFSVLVEILLLSYQIIYYPCGSCLFVGFLWFMLFVISWCDVFKEKYKYSFIGLVCLLLLSVNVFNYYISNLEPWSIYGNGKIKIFFSPSCEACKGVISKVLNSGLLEMGEVGLYPVAKNEEDESRICYLNCNKGQGLEDTLRLCLAGKGCSGKDIDVLNYLSLKYNLWKNRIYLSRMGVSSVPIVVSSDIEFRVDSGMVNELLGENLFNEKANGCSITEESDCL